MLVQCAYMPVSSVARAGQHSGVEAVTSVKRVPRVATWRCSAGM